MEKINSKNVSKIKIIIYLICSAFFVYAINDYFFINSENGNKSIVNILLFFVVFLGQKYTYVVAEEIKKRSYIFGLFLSIVLVVGKQIYETNVISSLFVSFRNIITELITIVGFAAILGAFFSLFSLFLIREEGLISKKKQWEIFQKQGLYYITWGLILVLWIPCLLAYYPGIFSYDMLFQTEEAINGFSAITKLQPPIHTMIWMVCLHLQKILNLEAILIYVVVQMIFFSAVLAKFILFLIKKRINNYLILFSFLFLSLNPVVSIFSVVATKDVYFGGFFVLANIFLVELMDNPKEFLRKKKNIIYLAMSMLLACLFRNNAIYVFIIVAIVYFFALKKKSKKIWIPFALLFSAYFLITIVLFSALQIGKGNTKEMLSVPMQQIANVMVTEPEAASNEMIERVDRYIPYQTISIYNPRFADYIKTTFNTEEFNSNKLEFFDLWLELLIKFPDNYINAFLTLNIPYWYPDASTLDSYSNREYIETTNSISEYYEINLDSKLPRLYERYEKVASYELFENIPLVSNLFSISTPIWILLFSVLIIINKRAKEKILILLPSLLLWMTYLLGPVSNFRYILPLFLLYPLYLSLFLETKKM